jgi:hypothetical protein
MSHFKIGDRVVYLHPEPTIGVVLGPEVYGVILVDLGGGREVHADPANLRPAMPRDAGDLAHGDWWWRNGEVVEVNAGPLGLRLWRAGRELAENVYPSYDWRGPVARPPEVRS